MHLRFLIFVLILSTVSLGQTSKNLDEGKLLKGAVKSVDYKRKYVIFKLKHVDEEPVLTGRDVYDSDGKLIQISIFGNGEERTTFSRVNGVLQSSVAYFDLAGLPTNTLGEKFQANTDERIQSDLCPTYVIRSEQGPEESIKIEREVCSDGSIRSSTTYESDNEKRLYRLSNEDSKGRTWVYVIRFGPDGGYTGYTYTVNNLKRPTYCTGVDFTSLRRDSTGNDTSSVGTVSPCNQPTQILYQFVEEKEIVYYPK